MQRDNAFARSCLYVHVSVHALTFESLDLNISFVVCGQCDFRFDLFFSFSFSFPVIFFVLVSF